MSKARFRDLIWNYRTLALPFFTSILSLLWFISEPGAEPAVAVLVSILTFSLLYFQERDTWYTLIQGTSWSLQARFIVEKHKQEFISNVLSKLDPVAKYKVNSEGEYFTLTIDSYSSIQADILRELARTGGGKLYRLTKGGKCIWEYEEP
jgi:hypothetical protein